MQADEEILKAFTPFGLTQELPTCTFDQMGRYLCLLYKTSDISENSVEELRWALFAQKDKEGQQLSPTRGTSVHCHTLRELTIWLFCGSYQKHHVPKYPHLRTTAGRQ